MNIVVMVFEFRYVPSSNDPWLCATCSLLQLQMKKNQGFFFYFDVTKGDWNCWEYFNYMF
jgi:hypothetical protein